LEGKQDINNLPLLNKYTDYKKWLHLVKPLLPLKLEDDFFIHELRKDENVMQMLLWIKVDYPEEVHEDVDECIIILEGRCRCSIGGKVVELGPGEFLEIPLYQHHNVKVLEPVLAVVQRIKVA
jgi:mannose-6-phosphate isomerase-like protein (cupin superfamily)